MLAAFAALCLSVWAQKAATEGGAAYGNGFPQTSFGRGILRFVAPARYRILFPFLLYPSWNGDDAAPLTPTKWSCYQLLRFGFLWVALALFERALGAPVMLCTAALFGLTLRYDYWSNAVELLAVAWVLAADRLGWSPLWSVGVGLILGTGRETTAFLGLLGTPTAVIFAAAALTAHVLVRTQTKLASKWTALEAEFRYGQPMWRVNLRSWRVDPYLGLQCLVWLAVAMLAAPAAPVLTALLVVVTFYSARIDEPRVLTLLCPFAALSASQLLGVLSP